MATPQEKYDAAIADLTVALAAVNDACERGTDAANELRAVGIAPENRIAVPELLTATAIRCQAVASHGFPVR
jgi:hypothetical protein